MMNEPIITTMLDQDEYKVGMADMILAAGHEDVQVRYQFINRHSDERHILEHVDIDELREQIDHVRSLRFQTAELRYLYGLGYISEDLLRYLILQMRMPEVMVEEREDGTLDIHTEGRWIDAIWWEVPILAIVNEMYFTRHQSGPGWTQEMRRRLDVKIERLREYPQLGFIEFGSRRRFSRGAQELVLRILMEETPRQLSGTSNLHFARQFNLKPMGTMAHELFMAYMGIYDGSDDALKNSQRYVLRDWWDHFRGPKSIALTDTVGSEWFFDNFTPEQARDWWGLRQDSGEPHEFGRRAIEFYRGLGIDPMRKMVVFSDGLDVEKMIGLWEEFSGQIGVGFGWGTGLTNDTGMDEPISIVMKLVEANGEGVCKLSDNPNKATGDGDAVIRAKRVFDHDGGEEQVIRY